MPEPTDLSKDAFSCSTSLLGSGEAWIRVGGELDLATAPEMLSACHRAQGRATCVLLDLRGLTFLDVAGLHAVLAAAADAADRGLRFAVLRGVPAVDAVFTLTNTRARIEILDADTRPDSAGVLAT